MTEQPADGSAPTRRSGGGLSDIFGANSEPKRGERLRSRLVSLSPPAEPASTVSPPVTPDLTPDEEERTTERRRDEGAEMPAGEPSTGRPRRPETSSPDGRIRPPAAPRTPSDVSADDAPPARRRGRPTGPSTAPSTVPAAAGGRRSKSAVVVYMNRPLREALKERCRRDRTAIADVVMDAVESTHQDGRLREAFAPVPTGGLFRRGPRRVVDRENAGTNSMVNFDLDTDNLQVLDSLWPEMSAPSRTKFITTALTLFLGVDDA